MTHYLYQQGIRIFDYAKFAEPLRERIRENAEKLAEAHEIKVVNGPLRRWSYVKWSSFPPLHNLPICKP